MKILLTNDDGVHAQGIRELAETLAQIATVTVVAPTEPRSGASSQITSRTPLRLTFMEESAQLPYQLYNCSGTPVDCVKLALNTLFASELPDLVVSGINHGRNDGICAIYSGTVGAAIEAAIARIPAVAFSLADHSDKCDFSEVCAFAKQFIPQVVEHGLPHTTMLNVNFPKAPAKGIKWAPQGTGRFVNEYMRAETPHGTPVYWMQGDQVDPDQRTGTDHYWLLEGYATISPLQIDMTDHPFLEQVAQQWPLHL